MKRFLIASVVALGLAAPAVADTLQEITTKGAVMEIQGQALTITFKADGTYATDQGAAGTWKIDGDKLCWASPGLTDSQCDAYPMGKKSGDSFEITNELLGTFKVTIK